MLSIRIGTGIRGPIFPGRQTRRRGVGSAVNGANTASGHVCFRSCLLQVNVCFRSMSLPKPLCYPSHVTTLMIIIIICIF
ncbi:hypothetical protein Dda3937_04362 [Dickeya dadantii 3937]|uniref:Uncharacterized protein n=1 Tax=Dickeya dadantii (strain 3937) TaxID=198628 RepID=E0SLD3_DICD3|nr:hypothetical protein Dda3937_04362 [Dickeya dadantii 3937]